MPWLEIAYSSLSTRSGALDLTIHHMKKQFLVLILFVVLFIWINSIMPSQISNEVSNSIVKLLGGTVTHCKEEANRRPQFLIQKISVKWRTFWNMPHSDGLP